MKLLENEILKLRALELEDIDMFSFWENDSVYWKQGNTIAPYSRYALKQYIIAAKSDIYETKELKLVIVRICDNQPIGIVDLFDIDHYHSRLEFGILIYPKYQKNGYSIQTIEIVSKYVLDFLHIHQMYCRVSESNEASCLMLEESGFVRTCVLKDWLRTESGFENAVMYQLIAHNYVD
ncbi:MAG: N-acetyltransferase [Bacteroidia bacterium]|nr:N-acetyltransferase [Bacteroidia bacterium]